jgi:hypothetical protein
MTQSKNRVHLSVNMPGELICVDIFERPDGTFGFEEFRRDVEDGQGWFAIGHHAHQVFKAFEAAKAAALEDVGWLASELTE